MKRTTLLAALIAASLPFSALAHKQWLLPSATVVAGNDAWVTVDAAVSNQLYYPDHVAMRLDNVSIAAPDGSTLPPQNPATGKYRSVFDVPLAQEGTYRIANLNRGLSARWDTPESLAAAKDKPAAGGMSGARGGFLRNATAEDLATKIPKNAQNLQVTEGIGRVETFVTKGKPSTVAATGKGLELVPVTHPSDLYVGEQFVFEVHYDGKPLPAQKVEIHAARGDDEIQPAPVELTTDAAGKASFALQQAGAYLALIRYRGPAPAGAAAPEYGNNYTLSFRVLEP